MKMTWARAFIAGCMTLALGVAACDSDDDKKNPTTTSGTDATTSTDATTATDAATTTATDAATTTTTDAATTTENDTSTTTTTDAATTTEEDTTGDTVTSAGECDNAGDLAIIAADPDAPADVAADCGISCLATPGGDTAVRACAADCVTNGKGNITGLGLSVECSGCYADVVICAKNNCLGPPGNCLAAPSGDACAQCREDAGCNAAFYECSGLTP